MRISWRVDISQWTAFERHVVSSMPGLRQALSKRIAEIVYNRSQQYVPVDTGQLKRSGLVEVLANGRSRVSYFRISKWGSGTFDVALWTHEYMIRAKKPWPRGPKYLTRAYINSDKDIDREFDLLLKKVF